MEMIIGRTAVGAALLAAAAAALGASFDCGKASTSVERMICADPGLASLDERMAATYRSASKRDPGVKTSQREWLANTRDKCGTTACLSEAYTARLAALQKPATASACTVTAQQLLGSWLNVDENSDAFDEARFTRINGEQGFVSYLHHAPFVTGSWTLKDCHVHIAGSGDRTDADYTITGLAKGRLSLEDESDGSALVLEKAK
jgi:uncharacterized protein